jgi:HPt (histidine-containing phosphotransfer) domain-containing protein
VPRLLQFSVDLSILHQTSSEMGADTAAGHRDLVEAYLEQGDGWSDQLGDAAATGDGEQAHRIAHAFGSSSVLIGARPLVTLLQQLSGTATEPAGLAAAIAAVRAEYQRVAVVLRTEYPPSAQ